MRRPVLQLILLLFVVFVLFKNRYRILSGLLCFQVIRHFNFSRLGERLMDRFLFSE